MTDSRASRKAPDNPEIERLEAELAGVARRIATLLTQGRYDEAALAELDVCAKQLRGRLDDLRAPARNVDWESSSLQVSGG